MKLLHTLELFLCNLLLQRQVIIVNDCSENLKFNPESSGLIGTLKGWIQGGEVGQGI